MSKQTLLFVLLLTITFFDIAHIRASATTDSDSDAIINITKAPLLVQDSSYSLTDTVEQVKRAITGHNFKIVRQQRLDPDSGTDIQDDAKEIIIYFCNFDKLDKALKLDKRAGLFLPCRISIVERQGKVYLMTVNPKVLNSLFQNPKLDKLCEELHQSYQEILEEATL